MSMSKQDFIALADEIRTHNNHSVGKLQPFTPMQIASLAEFCKRQNPAFKHERWFAYVKGDCGPNGGSIKK